MNRQKNTANKEGTKQSIHKEATAAASIYDHHRLKWYYRRPLLMDRNRSVELEQKEKQNPC